MRRFTGDDTLADADRAAIEEARDLIRRAQEARRVYAGFSQARVDRVTAAAVRAGARAAETLARRAVEDSGFGRVDSKVIKNRFATEVLWRDIAELKTVGVVRRDDRAGVLEIAEPYGVILGIIPITNPTSTCLFKGIIALKTRNAIVFSPHPRGVACIGAAATVMAEAAEAAGAPPGLITCMTRGSMDGVREAMSHPDIALILATGGEGLVKAAYSAGKPAYGVGPGNAPAFIERTANLGQAVKAIVASQTFDNGTICASEQSVVIDAPVMKRTLREFEALGAYRVLGDERRALEGILTRGGGLNPDIVGRYPHELAAMAGFSVPRDTTVLLADETGVGKEFPFSMEKLSPILAVYRAEGWEDGCETCLKLLRFGGMGHTLAIHSRNDEIIMKFALEKPVHRILVNAPTSQGGVGYATGLTPSMTLGCGAHGGNITSDNVSARHLLLYKRLARVKPGYVDRCAEESGLVRRKGRASSGKAASRSMTGKGGGLNYRNRAYNEPQGHPPLFDDRSVQRATSRGSNRVTGSPALTDGEPVPDEAKTDSASEAPGMKTAVPSPTSTETKDLPPERCPLGGGCPTCGDEDGKACY